MIDVKMNIDLIATKSAELVDVCTQAIEWSEKAAQENHRIFLDRADNYHSFLRSRLAARKIRESSERAPCVGVFGPSQAGKSYLVSALSKGEQGSLMVNLGGELIDFLQKINPGGGRESTGVVTRFSIHSPERVDLNYPVEIRLLSESDVLKILFNSFFSDFDHAGALTLRQFTEEDIRERIENLELLADKSVEKSNFLRPEDVLDLRLYLENSYANLVGNLRTDYWSAAISLAPRLTIEKRAELFSIVWCGFDLFTSLYITVAKTIERLGGASVCLAPINSVVSDVGQTGIVDAQLLNEMLQTTAPSIEIRPIIDREVQSSIKISKSVLAALTAELRLTIPDGRWNFLKNLDILDFPGARSRLKISDPLNESSDPKQLAAELFLRGKVAFLFQRYTVDQELASVLLCVPWGPQEVTGYAPLIDLWVKEANGDSVEKRSSVPPGLLFVLTKFDMDLQSKGGDNETTERQRWPDRIRSSLLERFGNMEWVSDWNGKPFCNMFWLRNPEIRDSAYMKYENGVEVGISNDHKERINRLKNYFIDDDLVNSHFENPAEAWDAAMIPRDGGIARIVHGIDRVSNPQFRLQGLIDKNAKIADVLKTKLSQYFNEGRDQEVVKKLEIYNQIKQQLVSLVKNRDIWKLFDCLNLTLDELRSLYFAVASGVDLDKNLNDSNQSTEHSSQDLDNFLDSMLGDGGEALDSRKLETRVHERATIFAQKSIDAWSSKIRNLAHDSNTVTNLICSEAALSLLVEELIGASQRLALVDDLAEQLHSAESNAGATWETIVDRQITIVRNMIGDFVCQLGMSNVPMSERPGIPPGNPKRRVFEPFKLFEGDLPPLTDVPVVVSLLESRDWLVALEKVLTDNAGFAGQGTLSPELNRELGAILSSVKLISD